MDCSSLTDETLLMDCDDEELTPSQKEARHKAMINYEATMHTIEYARRISTETVSSLCNGLHIQDSTVSAFDTREQVHCVIQPMPLSVSKISSEITTVECTDELTEQELDEFTDKEMSKRTNAMMKSSVAVLASYAASHSTTVDHLSKINPAELDNFLAKFFTEIRKTDGTFYGTSGLRAIRFGLRNHFAKLCDYNILRGPQFRKSQDTFSELLMNMKLQGTGCVQHKQPPTKDDFEKLHSSGLLSIETPSGLQNKVFIDILMHFHHPGRVSLRGMKKTDFVISVDSIGRRYVFLIDKLSKNCSSNKTAARMYEIPGNPQCPMLSFEKYLSKLHPGLDFFWQNPKRFTFAQQIPLSPWYDDLPVGRNKLSSKMRSLSIAANLSNIYSNDCLRVASWTSLYNVEKSKKIISDLNYISSGQAYIDDVLEQNRRDVSCQEMSVHSENAMSIASQSPSAETVTSSSDPDHDHRQLQNSQTPTVAASVVCITPRGTRMTEPAYCVCGFHSLYGSVIASHLVACNKQTCFSAAQVEARHRRSAQTVHVIIDDILDVLFPAEAAVSHILGAVLDTVDRTVQQKASEVGHRKRKREEPTAVVDKVPVKFAWSKKWSPVSIMDETDDDTKPLMTSIFLGANTELPEPAMDDHQFADLEDDKSESSLEDRLFHQRTKQVIRSSVQMLDEYARLYHQTTVDDLICQLPAEVDSILARFYAELRKRDGTDYSYNGLKSVRFGLQKFFLAKCKFDIIHDRRFRSSSEMYTAVLIKLKECGKGKRNVQHKQPLTASDFNKLYNSNVLTTDTPDGLQNKVFIDFMLHLYYRGNYHRNLRNLQKDDFSISTDSSGKRYAFLKEKFTRNHHVAITDMASQKGRMYEVPGSERCPILSLEKYLAKLHPGINAFWQRPRLRSYSISSVWYDNVPVGKNTLGERMKVISMEAGLSTVYTNLCLRATCITALDHHGFEARNVMAISAQNSEASLRSFNGHISETMHRAISRTLSFFTTAARPVTNTSDTANKPITIVDDSANDCFRN